jgi:hypothetical protein
MNIFREGPETIIDPMFPLANAPMSPQSDFLVNIGMLIIEIWAFVRVLKIVKGMDKSKANKI